MAHLSQLNNMDFFYVPDKLEEVIQMLSSIFNFAVCHNEKSQRHREAYCMVRSFLYHANTDSTFLDVSTQR